MDGDSYYDLFLRALRVLRGSIALLLAGSLLAVFSSPLAGSDQALARATFAGGCFWCMEPPFDQLEGVVETISGFSGGHVAYPSYEAVVGGGTGHLEAVQVIYDPDTIAYEQLLHVFWRNIDPLQADGQFCDRGPMYRTAIFAHDEQQFELATASRDVLAASGQFDQPIVTGIRRFSQFYPAEDYHQGYYRKHPTRYRYYRWRCGRDQRLEELWGEQAGGEWPGQP